MGRTDRQTDVHGSTFNTAPRESHIIRLSHVVKMNDVDDACEL